MSLPIFHIYCPICVKFAISDPHISDPHISDPHISDPHIVLCSICEFRQNCRKADLIFPMGLNKITFTRVNVEVKNALVMCVYCVRKCTTCSPVTCRTVTCLTVPLAGL